MIYFTGCTHFDHENIIRLAGRPFNNVEEMNETIIENWNKTVSKDDTVYHLGDFSFRSERNSSQYVKRLNGKITFIRGNHDPKTWGTPYLEFKHQNVLFCLFHYPIEEWNGFYRNSVHIHCHTHKPKLQSAKNRFNVTVEATDYTPISIEKILEMRDNGNR